MRGIGSTKGSEQLHGADCDFGDEIAGDDEFHVLGSRGSDCLSGEGDEILLGRVGGFFVNDVEGEGLDCGEVDSRVVGTADDAIDDSAQKETDGGGVFETVLREASCVLFFCC